MKKLPLLTFAVLLSASTALAQNRIVTTSSVSDTGSFTGFARDFWFALLLNYENQSGKYYQMYVSALEKTTVNVSIGQANSQRFPINALEVLVFDIPLSWEIRGSGEVEDKAVHVWSDDADLAVSVLSRNPASTDGLTVLPTTALGTEYVVASFASYAYLPGNELPSEFNVIANEDNTVVEITPSTDLRQGISTSVAYPRNKKFSVILNRGQAVQYMASAANGNMTGYDVTGTIVKSNKLIGVIGGVECANIPAENPYCDHICEMIMPVSRWGKKYYTAPFVNRKGGDGILCIAKEDNTVITRSSMTGTQTHCILNKYESYIRHDIDEASMWASNKPFMVVQYCNGTDYPETGANNGIGDPNMISVPSVMEYEKTVLFHTPKIRSAESQFRNYVNIVVHKKALASTKFDGHPITFPALTLPDTNYAVLRASDIKPGAHTVESDSGVGVYVYGYGSYDSYGWTGMRGGGSQVISTSSDTIAPVLLNEEESCYSTRIELSEPAGIGDGQLALSPAGMQNATLTAIEKSGNKNEVIAYTFQVTDSTKPAAGNVKVMDAAGNLRIVSHTYTPDLPSIPNSLVEVKTQLGGNTEFSLPIAAGMNTPLTNVEASVVGGNEFLVLHAPVSVAAGMVDSIVVRSFQRTLDTYLEQLVVTADCWNRTIPLKTSPTPFSAFIVRDTVIDFGLVVVGNKRTRIDHVVNAGSEPFTIDSITLEGAPSFTLNTPGYPEGVAFKDSSRFDASFQPTTDGVFSGYVTVHTSIGNARVRLAGKGSSQGGVKSDLEGKLVSIYPNPAKDNLKVVLGDIASASQLRLLDATGRELYRRTLLQGGPAEFLLDLSSYATGGYLLEVTFGEDIVTRKFSIER